MRICKGAIVAKVPRKAKIVAFAAIAVPVRGDSPAILSTIVRMCFGGRFMPRPLFVFAAMLLGVVLFAQHVAAQDYVTSTSGGTRIWAGGGVQFLSLPEIKFTGVGGVGNVKRQDNTKKDFWDAGGAGAAGIETSLGNWGGWLVTGTFKGFYANVETDRRVSCSGATNCVVTDPTGAITFVSGRLSTKTDRDADYWGGQAELKFGTGVPQEVKPEMYRNDFFILGFDVRGIDQDNKLSSSTGTVFTLRETLDTTYTGGYIGLGGEYSFGFVPVVGKWLKGQGGFLDRLGFRTYLKATAGFYNASTDYSGRFTGPAATATRLSTSDDDFAFIGTLSLETRKQLSQRTSISLWTDYEYISSAPSMHYANNARDTTRIETTDAFATRTMLRLNIGLGSNQLYAPAYNGY